MTDGEPSEGHVDDGGGARAEGRAAAAPPAGEGPPAQPLAEIEVRGPMDRGLLAVDVGGVEPIAVPPSVLVALMQQMQLLADGQQALAGRIDALDNNQGPQHAQLQQPPQPQHEYPPAGGSLVGGAWLLPGAGAIGVSPPAA